MIDSHGHLGARLSATPSLRRRNWMGIGFALCLIVGSAAGCGGDDGADVREVGSEGSGSGSASGSGSGSASGTEEAKCAPVGTELEETAGEEVAVDLLDYEFEPSEIDVAAGVVTFVAKNGGTENHELAFLPGGGEVPMNDENKPDEDALAEAGAFELEGFGPGQTCNATYELKPGTYTLFCIVESKDGETHLSKGMEGKLTVT